MAVAGKNLFIFSQKTSQGGGSSAMGASPKLEHIGTGADQVGLNTQSFKETYINVRDEFPWHNSPYNSVSINESPWIDLLEYDILANPMLNQIAANISVAGNVIPDAIKAKIKSQASQARNADGSSSAIDKLLDGTDSNAFEKTEPGDTLFPYHNMYTTNPTGFRYLLPYFTGNHHQLINSFSTDKGETGSGLGSGLMSLGEQMSETVANISKGVSMNIVEPGSYIEKSKFFNFSGREKTYQFAFPLSNSRNHPGMNATDSISRNWQLLFLLIYQNSPNRMSRDLILPPAIYEAHIPGVWYSKYSYISQLDIKFLGTRRMGEVNIPTLGGSTARIQSIIPDAYLVSIGVTELVSESQNMLYHMSKGKNVISVGTINN